MAMTWPQLFLRRLFPYPSLPILSPANTFRFSQGLLALGSFHLMFGCFVLKQCPSITSYFLPLHHPLGAVAWHVCRQKALTTELNDVMCLISYFLLLQLRADAHISIALSGS